MSTMNSAMTSSTTEVTPVSSQSIRRWKRRRLRWRAAMLVSRITVSHPGDGIPIPSG